MGKTNQTSKISVGNIISFFLIEVLMLISFNLSGNMILYGSLMLLTLVLIIAFGYKEIKTKGMSTFFFFLIPLLCYGLLSILSGFTKDSLSAISNPAIRVFTMIGFLTFSSVGYLSIQVPGFKIKNILLGIYCALGLYVLINLLITMIQFSPFYPLIYKGYYFYYDGAITSKNLGEIAYALIGFENKEVSLSYFTLFASLLSTAVVGLFFIDRKEEKRTFIAYAILGGIGVLALLLTPSKMSLITDFALIVTLLFVVLSKKVKWNTKIVKRVVIAIAIVLGILFLLFVLNAQENVSGLKGLQNAIASVPLLNKLFNTNGLSASYKNVISHLTVSGLMNGFQPGYYDLGSYEKGFFLSGSWLFDNVMVSGVFGQLFFIITIVIGFKFLFIYFNKSNDEDSVKALIVSYVLIFFVITLLNYDSLPYIFSDKTVPMYLLAPFMICVFFFGYAIARNVESENNKEVIDDEKVN